MKNLVMLMVVSSAVVMMSTNVAATDIDEVLEPPSSPGNTYSGTFFITPSDTTWAFGVGNDEINDTSISGIASIDGLEANDHWISSLISKDGWDLGYDFDSARPIGATEPSSFSIDTTSVPWQWGSNSSVAFYWLSEAGPDDNNPLAVLQPGTQYDAFRFFTSGPNSPFATFNAADGGVIATGETSVTVIPEPSTVLATGVVLVLFSCRRRRR